MQFIDELKTFAVPNSRLIDNKDNFSVSDWNSLYKLAEDTFVEESDSLKQGAAGAGHTDND